MAAEITLTRHLMTLFQRDLDKLTSELQAYASEEAMWLVTDGISNSAGNLALHLIGNLNHFIGAGLGQTGYQRQREREFSQKNSPLASIIEDVNATKHMIENVLSQLDAADLEREFKRNPFEDAMTTEYFLMHLLTHLSYHLGQINYHRRIIGNH